MELNEFIKQWMFTEKQELFFRAYIEAVYFTDTGDTGQPESDAELTHEFLRSAAMDCNRFYNTYHALFPGLTSQAAHDFWLTRNGHGSGFWDRDGMYGKRTAEELNRSAALLGPHDSEFTAYPDDEEASQCATS